MKKILVLFALLSVSISFAYADFDVTYDDFQSGSNKEIKNEGVLNNKEFEADKEAVMLVASAGYNLKGADETMEFISDLNGVYTLYSSHPEKKKRIERIKKTISEIDLNKLKNEGQRNLYNSPVLKPKKSSDRKTVVMSKPSDYESVGYNSEGDNQKLIKRTYSCYLNNDMEGAKSYFEQAFKFDSTNYIPALYLSYIWEYNYKLNNNKDDLKNAMAWIHKAKNINKTDGYIIEQEKCIEIF